MFLGARVSVGVSAQDLVAASARNNATAVAQILSKQPGLVRELVYKKKHS